MNIVAADLIPKTEPQRMAAVNRYEVLDTPPDGAFDRITAIAARLFGVPISIISIVDHDRIWFKSHHGIDVTEIPREPGLCASAILSTDPHILPDASADPRSLANPLVAGDFGLRFYAGVPLTTSDGHNLGTLCVIDKTARPITKDQIEDLKDLASLVIDQLELRLSARRAIAQNLLMAREIDHRVTNSLQFVSGLLTMQSRASDNDGVTAQLQEAATRVAAVARVHRNFYSTDADEVSALAFLRRLCAEGTDGERAEKRGPPERAEKNTRTHQDLTAGAWRGNAVGRRRASGRMTEAGLWQTAEEGTASHASRNQSRETPFHTRHRQRPGLRMRSSDA